jgi:membrane protein DedA with SNARE-associated domain
MLHSLAVWYHAQIHSLIEWYMNSLATGGYPLVGLLMAMESSILPLPSELVIPPVAHLAHSGQIPLGLPGIVLAGTIGSWVGATLMYWAARLAGRPLVMRYGRYVLIPMDKVEGAERWASHYGSMGVFIARLVPVVRHLIGIPAGIVRLDFRLFSVFTLAGSAIWCSVLCYVGIKVGQDERFMKGDLHQISLWLGGAMLVLGAMYYFLVHRHMKAARTGGVPPSDKAASRRGMRDAGDVTRDA